MEQQAASRLLNDLRRSPGMDLPIYQEDTVRRLLQDMKTLQKGIAERAKDGAAQGPDGGPRHFVLNAVEESFLRRNKRCLLVYHSARGDRVEFMRWNTGAVLPARAKDNMHSSEVDYFKAYSAAVSRYLDGCRLDLTAVRCMFLPPLQRVALGRKKGGRPRYKRPTHLGRLPFPPCRIHPPPIPA